MVIEKFVDPKRCGSAAGRIQMESAAVRMREARASRTTRVRRLRRGVVECWIETPRLQMGVARCLRAVRCNLEQTSSSRRWRLPPSHLARDCQRSQTRGCKGTSQDRNACVVVQKCQCFGSRSCQLSAIERMGIESTDPDDADSFGP